MKPEILSEAEIEYWTRIFQANRFDETHGLQYQQFMEMPHEYLMAAIYHLPWPMRSGEEIYPLLPAQQAVADRLQQEESIELLSASEESVLDANPSVECRNGQWHEPLHHRAHPRRPAARRMPS